ncbi:hypothetical protein ACTXT7_000591 [Hymenolepis weldensis]
MVKDALTVRRMDSPFSPSSWQEKDYLAPWRNSRPNTSPANDAMSVTSAACLRTYCRASPGSSVYSSLSISGTNSASRLASTPTGSLIVFRVHSAITDDAQSLVEFLTILLSEGAFDEESKSPAVNPQESGTSKIGEVPEHSKHIQIVQITSRKSVTKREKGKFGMKDRERRERKEKKV